jgi:CHAT domain-containing protein
VRRAWSRLYELLARLQVESGRGEDAFATLDRRQDVAMKLESGPATASDPELQASLDQAASARHRTQAVEQELTSQAARGDRGKVAHLRSLLAATKQQFFAALGDIRARDPDYERLLAVRPVNFAAIQSSIPDDTVLVELFPASDRLYLFVVTRDRFKIVTVDVRRSEIDRLVREFRGEISEFTPRGGERLEGDEASSRTMRKALVSLHALLVDPIEEELKGHEVIAFIPTGTLFYMPLQALAREKGGKLEYLLERKQVAVLAKASDIAQLREKPQPARGRLVAFGNPDGSLAGSQAEVADLAALFPGAEVFLGPQATHQRLLGLGGRIAYLHLATHGILDARNPNGSYMLLAGDEPRLHVGEIFGLPLHGTRLVTLSACQTAIAGQTPGSEISSMAEAFSIAGSPTVVASLWRVSDSATRALMVAFYRNLKSGMSRGRALQQAELGLLRSKDHAHPFYWAPFELFGDWR